MHWQPLLRADEASILSEHSLKSSFPLLPAEIFMLLRAKTKMRRAGCAYDCSQWHGSELWALSQGTWEVRTSNRFLHKDLKRKGSWLRVERCWEVRSLGRPGSPRSQNSQFERLFSKAKAAKAEADTISVACRYFRVTSHPDRNAVEAHHPVKPPFVHLLYNVYIYIYM